jgi:hypothetical protein
LKTTPDLPRTHRFAIHEVEDQGRQRHWSDSKKGRDAPLGDGRGEVPLRGFRGEKTRSNWRQLGGVWGGSPMVQLLSQCFSRFGGTRTIFQSPVQLDPIARYKVVKTFEPPLHWDVNAPENRASAPSVRGKLRINSGGYISRWNYRIESTV